MEPLYETDSVWTLDEYVKFNYVVAAKQIKRTKKAWVILTVCMLLLGIILVAVPFLETEFGIILICASVLYVAIYFLRTKPGIDKKIKSAWESDKSIRDVASHFSFYENELVSVNDYSTEKARYADIFKIIETDTNYYIMISEIKGMSIVKANCSDELVSFIRGLGSKGVDIETV